MDNEEEAVVRRKKKDEMLTCLTEEDIEKYNEAFSVIFLSYFTSKTVQCLQEYIAFFMCLQIKSCFMSLLV